MPAVYTHYIVAREAWKSLSDCEQENIRPFLSLYFFGAQGADFCFFYKFLNPQTKNLGSYLHRKGGYQAFRILKAFSVSSPAILAYSLGYITHYATDVVFHPHVYAVSKKSLLKHSRVENALDGYFKRANKSTFDLYKEFFHKKLSPEEEHELFLVYAAIAANADFPPLTKPSFRRAIRLFNAYLPMPNVFFGDEKHLSELSVANNASDKKTANELFVKAVVTSRQLMQEFLQAVRKNKALSFALFGKNYLTGEINT